MSVDYEKMSVFEQLQAGLEDSILYSKGKLSLKTTTLPSPPPRVEPAQIVSLRKKLRMSQAVFAATLNVSTRTVQSWEQGAREPSDAALRMIQIVRLEPRVVKRFFATNSSGRRRRSARKSKR